MYRDDHGCPRDENTCYAAAAKGYLDCLVYAHEHGCPWNGNTCNVAAKKGHLDCLVYATVSGCSWCFIPSHRKENILKKWHAARVITRWALRIRKRKIIRAVNIISHAWLEYSYSPEPGRPGYERTKENFRYFQIGINM